MSPILPLLRCLQSEISMTTIRQFSRIVLALLAMTGRVTLLGISRWAGDGARYRTVQRFFATVLPWAHLFWHFFRVHLFDETAIYLRAGDETVVTKAGTQTHGLDRFFAGLYGRAVPGLAFFTLSLIRTTQRRSFPIAVEHVLRVAAAHSTTASPVGPPAASTKRKPGRPKGSTPKAKTAPDLSPELTRIQQMITRLLTRIGALFPLRSVVMDGHFGTNAAVQMIRHCAMHRISKLRADSALYLPYDGPSAGRGARRIYGARLDPHAPPTEALRHTSTDAGVETCIYQLTLRHKHVAAALNVVLLVKTHLTTRRHAHVLLFSSDMGLTYDTLHDYYRLRFQREFNFRDAKHYWGLEDFMNITPIAVTNATNLSLFMVNLTERLLHDHHQHGVRRVLDLKAHYRGSRYLEELLKLLPEKPEPVLFGRLWAKMRALGRIHAPPPEPICT